jgi:hypothetical protein
MMPKEMPTSDQAPYRLLGYVFDAAGVVHACYRATTPQTCTRCGQTIPRDQCFTCSEDSPPLHPDEQVCVQCRPFTASDGEATPDTPPTPVEFAPAPPALSLATGATDLSPPGGDEPFPLRFLRLLEGVVSERDLQVVAWRCGLIDGQERTLAQVGELFGLSRERVRQLEERAVKRIQHHCRTSREEPLALLLADLRRRIHADSEDTAIGEALWQVASDDLQGNWQLFTLVLRMLYSKKEREWLLEQRRRAHLVQLVAQSTAAREERREAQLAHLWAQIIWPAQLQRTTRELLEARYPPSPLSRPDATGDTFRSTKLGRTVQAASPLDLDVFTQLDCLDEVDWYQEQPQLGPAVPSALVLLTDGRIVVVEVVPLMDMVLAVNWSRWAVLRQWCQEHGAGLLITDGWIGAQELGHYPVKAAFEQALLGALQAGPLTWPAYQEIRDAHGASFRDFAAVVWRHRLQWERHPFVLRGRSG